MQWRLARISSQGGPIKPGSPLLKTCFRIRLAIFSGGRQSSQGPGPPMAMPVHECNSPYCRSTYPYEKLNPMITERLLYTDKKATNSFVNNLCLLRKTRTCRNQQEMSWGLNEICISMQWLLEGGDLLQEQPVGFEVQTPVGVLSLILSIFC